MNPVLGQCPVCHAQLEIVKLYCRHCDTTIEGHFALGGFFQLSPEQLAFVELFVRSEGKINRVCQELGLSYPAVRARLEDVIASMGYEVSHVERAELMTEEDRREILAQVAAGELSADEAITLLKTV